LALYSRCKSHPKSRPWLRLMFTCVCLYRKLAEAHQTPNELQPQGTCKLQGQRIEALGLPALVLPVNARQWVLVDNKLTVSALVSCSHRTRASEIFGLHSRVLLPLEILEQLGLCSAQVLLKVRLSLYSASDIPTHPSSSASLFRLVFGFTSAGRFL
jgi:hypothetical protein